MREERDSDSKKERDLVRTMNYVFRVESLGSKAIRSKKKLRQNDLQCKVVE